MDTECKQLLPILEQRENPAVHGGRESRHSITQPTVYSSPNAKQKLLVPK